MQTVHVKTSGRSELVDITSKVSQLIPADLSTGICHVFCRHTTAGLTVNENADPDVKHDLLATLENLVPWNNSMYRHFEGNSAAHMKASMMGFSQTLPIRDGQLDLGTWQSLYFCEFDGPRSRTVTVQFFRDLQAN